MIRIQVIGIAPVQDKIDRIAGLDTGSLMTALAATVERQTKRRIASEKTSPDGARWAPLKASTILKKGTDNILVDKGQLLGSISSISGATWAIVGTNVFYGEFHQSGTRKMVERPFIGISSANAREIENVVQAFISVAVQ